eukprot:403369941
MCLTISGMPLPIITITNPNSEKKPIQKRQAIFISARVHPGETNSSYVCNGFLNFITNTNPQSRDYQTAYNLRENFIFKIVPCLNPDGVACGNYRTSLAGVDLNRQWVCPHPQLHPSIFHFKSHMEVVAKDREILLYCDMHGHSKKKNSFIYACNAAANGGFQSWTKVRLFPRLLAKNSFRFNLQDCTFKVEKSKLGTARIVVWKEFSVTNSFTLENSFFGYDYGIDGEIREFKVVDYHELGCEIARSIWEYKELSVQIQKELNLTKGWLKPKLLLQVTGIPAVDRIKEEIKEQNKRKIKNILQSNNNANQSISQQMQKLQSQASIKNSFSLSNQIQKEQNIQQSFISNQNNRINQIQNKIQVSAVLTIQRFIKQYQRNKRHQDLQSEFMFETIQTVNADDLMQSIDTDKQLSSFQQPKHQPQQLQNTAGQFSLKSPKKQFKEDQSFINEQTPTSNLSKETNLNWRDYFTIEELEKAYNLILQGQEPELQEENFDDGSDSCPSEDNLDIKELYNVIYVRKKYHKREIESKIQTENEYLKKFEKYVRKQIKQIKRQGSNAKSDDKNSIESNNQPTVINRNNVRIVKQDTKKSNQDGMQDKFSKIKLILRSKSKEQLGVANTDSISRDINFKQINKQNRSLGYEDQMSLTNESISNLNGNMFLPENFTNQISKQTSPTTIQQTQNLNQSNIGNIKKFRLKSPEQILEQKLFKQDDNESSSLMNLSKQVQPIKNVLPSQNLNQTPLLRRRLKSLETNKDLQNKSQLQNSISQTSNDYTQLSSQQPNNLIKKSLVEQRKLMQSVQQDRRYSSQDYLQNSQQNLQPQRQMQPQNYSNLVPQQSQSKTVFLNNQYPILPLLSMEGTNIQKSNQMIQKHQKQEQQIIQKESQSFIRDFMDINLEANLRKNQFQIQRPQTNQVSQQFFTKRMKSKSPDMIQGNNSYNISQTNFHNKQVIKNDSNNLQNSNYQQNHSLNMNQSLNQISNASNQSLQQNKVMTQQSNIVNSQQNSLNQPQKYNAINQMKSNTQLKNATIASGLQKQSFKLQNLIPEIGIKQYQQNQVQNMNLSSGFNNFKQPQNTKISTKQQSFLVQSSNNSSSQKQTQDSQRTYINQQPTSGISRHNLSPNIAHSKANLQNNNFLNVNQNSLSIDLMMSREMNKSQ